jgi:hypothetical protein
MSAVSIAEKGEGNYEFWVIEDEEGVPKPAQ